MIKKLLLIAIILHKSTNAINGTFSFNIKTLRDITPGQRNRNTNSNMHKKAFYSCTINNLKITTRNVQITDILKIPIIFTDLNIQWLQLESSIVNYLPHGFDKFFGDIQILNIGNVELLELKQEDLIQFPNLKYLWAHNNKLFKLGHDIFDFNLNLEYFDFSGNQLKFVDYRLLKRTGDRPTDVEMFCYSFENNICINYSGCFTIGYGSALQNCNHENEILCVYEISSCNVITAYEYLMIRKTKVLGEFDGDGHDDRNITKVSISNSNFTKIPGIFAEKFEKLESFGIRGKIKFLNPENLRIYKKLKKLNLSGNRIEDLKSDAFIFNPHLQVIDISNNQIYKIGTLTFSILKNLNNLNLNYNARIDENFQTKYEIENSKKLSKIFFNDTIDCAFSTSNFRYVGQLYFCHVINPKELNFRTVILENFYGFTGRHAENKSHQNVEVLIAKFTISTALNPKVSYHFPNLKLIRITSSNLMYLHDNNFDDLQNLQVLDLSDNKITEVPSGIFKNNEKLIFVDFSRNKIAVISEIFGNFFYLDKFKIFENQNFNFEMSRKTADFNGQPLDNLNTTTSLFSENNKKYFNFFGHPQKFEIISTSSNLVINCRSIEYTDFFWTNKKTCQDRNVQQISNLQDISEVNSKFDVNLLTSLEIESEVMYYLPTNISKFFPNLSQLKAKKRIKKIFRINFKNLPNLKYIYLQDNDIEFIDDDHIFQDNPKLEVINLEGNKIKKISENVFVNLINFEKINLNSNECAMNEFCVSNEKTIVKFNKSTIDNICGAKLPMMFSYYGN